MCLHVLRPCPQTVPVDSTLRYTHLSLTDVGGSALAVADELGRLTRHPAEVGPGGSCTLFTFDAPLLVMAVSGRTLTALTERGQMVALELPHSCDGLLRVSSLKSRDRRRIRQMNKTGSNTSFACAVL